MLYQHEISGDPFEKVVEGFWQIRRTTEAGRALAESLARGAQSRLAELDARIAAHTTNWRLDRVALVDRTVLRLGAYELLHSTTPPSVVIDEAVELAKRFGEADSASFVNGILDALMRAAGRAAAGAGPTEGKGNGNE